MDTASLENPPPAVSPSTAAPAPGSSPALTMPLARRLAMVAFGYIPFLTVTSAAVILALARAGTWPAWSAWLAPGLLLLLPPLVVRITLAVKPLPTTDVALDSPAFLVWWFTAQWQVLFNRLPWIEEMIRLVPGLYSAWLRLWGARVGRFVYWTPGLRILDRSLVQIGHRVVFGAGVKINPHIIMPGADGRLVLKAAAVRIGDAAMVGGYSLLTSGSWIAAGEASPGKRDFRPFTGWANGRRVDEPQGDGA